MRRFRFIFYAVLLMVVGSCEFKFDVKTTAPDGLYVQALCRDDKLTVRFKYVSALGVAASDMPELAGRDMTIIVSADSQPLLMAMCKYPDRAQSKWFSVDFDSEKYLALPLGTPVQVSVEMEGMEPVHGSTMLVGGAELSGVKLHRELISGMEMSVYEVGLDMESLPEGLGYVAVMIQKFEHYPESGQEQEHTVVTWLNPTLAASTDPNVELAQVCYDSFQNCVLDDFPLERDEHKEAAGSEAVLTIAPLEAFRNGVLGLTIMRWTGPVMPGRPGGGGSGSGSGGSGSGSGIGSGDPEVKPEVTYKFYVYGVSPEFYRYSLAKYKSQHDYMAMMGLAPAQFAWSNIVGSGTFCGFGFCGAISGCSTSTFNEQDILQ